jgi:hypothetical protein
VSPLQKVELTLSEANPVSFKEGKSQAKRLVRKGTRHSKVRIALQNGTSVSKMEEDISVTGQQT